ncbi:ComF family protein [Thermosyntropha sp.]|uniref:ComF family protein n=1 Tax=Thermosyntropha sp. TaxID=2740820 RepID=UPI0025ED18C3|nr:ComF family protein [Thermosyntropha sp.]MBO8159047.1 ComF family protein [Thermosyntropha sp.]
MFDFILDIIFPMHKCSLCRKPGRYTTSRPWCDECEKAIRSMRQDMHICDRCGKVIPADKFLCQDCSVKEPPFAIARAVGPYEDSCRIAIKVLKFLGKRNLSVAMGKMMAEVVKGEPRYFPIDLIVPVPASKGHLEQRGFNQTAEMAKSISRQLKIKMDDKVLIRVKETPPQRELSKEEREKNLLCAFEVKDKKKIYRKNILLVDDVYTTGSTSRECARTLLGAGAERVAVITWATGHGF